MGSSFEDLVARNTTAKTDFDLNIRFESYAFLKFRSDLHIFVTSVGPCAILTPKSTRALQSCVRYFPPLFIVIFSRTFYFFQLVNISLKSKKRWSKHVFILFEITALLPHVQKKRNKSIKLRNQRGPWVGQIITCTQHKSI